MFSALELAIVIFSGIGLYLYQRYAGREKSDIQLENNTLQQLENENKLKRETHPQVQAILKRLHSHINTSKSEYRQFVLDDPGINAMALPAGTILLTSGMITAIDNQTFNNDELAGILAHEIGHIEQGHASQKVEEEARSYLLKTGISVVSRHPIIKMLTDALSTLVSKNLSRQCEYEADAWSQKLLKFSDYQSDGLIKALTKINALSQASHMTDVFSTHPNTDERIKRLRQLLAS